MRTSLVPFRVFLLALILLIPIQVWAGQGDQPMNLDVSPSGNTILITSLESDSITQFHNNAKSHLNVGGTTWGVTFIDSLTAVVTHYDRDRLTILTRTQASSPFMASDLAFHDGAVFDYSLKFSTGVCVDPNAPVPTFYVANRGISSHEQAGDSWRHVVHKFELAGSTLTHSDVIEVDREPREVAIASAGSPATSVLLVSHVQGTVGVQDLPAYNFNPLDQLQLPWDGGTVLAIDLDTMSETRFILGSPVREVSIRETPAGHNTAYRVFMTHVGEGAQSEDPAHGGIFIPNVITSIGFDNSHDPVDREDIIINHDNDWPTTVPSEVVPEQIAFTSFNDGQETYHYAWITNASSGSVTRLLLAEDGHIAAGSQTFDLLSWSGAPFPASTYQVVKNRRAAIATEDATSQNISNLFQMPQSTGYRTQFISFDNSSAPVRSSVPRGIVASPDMSKVFVVTQFEHELCELSAETDPTTAFGVSSNLVATTPELVGDHERNFFTAGDGFTFREGENDPVDNLSCITCHPAGHHDGKIRLTGVIIAGNPAGTEPVVTPSSFDVGSTEWIFFNGQRTILDNHPDCNYCQDTMFFGDTKEYTDALLSPDSPYASEELAGSDDFGLTTGEEYGRAWFDVMACSRCHQSTLPTFPRADASVPGIQTDGPLFTNEPIARRMLNDRTQVMVANTGVGVISFPSDMNMTDVGTRPMESEFLKVGVNTPALAGAWDARPYLHDGRYATMDEVLSHTWLSPNLTCDEPLMVSATPWDSSPSAACSRPGTVPDNFADDLDREAGEGIVGFDPGTVHEFGNHGETMGSNFTTNVKTYLETQGAYQEFLDFLKSLSSQTDPCEGTDQLSISNVKMSYDDQSTDTEITWDTQFPVASVVWSTTVGGIEEYQMEGPDTQHWVVVQGGVDPVTSVELDAEMVLCGTAATSITCDTSQMVSGLTAASGPICNTLYLDWYTQGKVACRVEWAPVTSSIFTNTITTPAGKKQSVALPVTPGVDYKVRITPLTANEDWCGTYYFPDACNKAGQGNFVVTKTQIESVSPNPFNPSTTISFTLKEQGPAEIKIFDLRGVLVKRLLDETMAAGRHQVVWHGKDKGGSQVSSGVYFLRLKSGDVLQSQRITLLK